MAIRTAQLIKAAFLCTLSAHLAAEAIRRFVFYSNAVYAIADAVVLFSAFLVLRYARVRIPTLLSVFVLMYLVWGAICLAVDGGSPQLALVGARPLVLAFSAYVVARGYFGSISTSSRTMADALFAWATLALLVGILQLLAGIGEPINRLPDGAASENAGIGDYDVAGVGLAGIFRPTSIFMHTGRLGQFAFYVSLVIAVTAVLDKQGGARRLVFPLVGVALVLLSGQRAAMLFLVVAMLSLSIAVRNYGWIRKALLAFTPVAGLILLINPDLGHLMWDRFVSVIGLIDERVVENTSDVAASLEKFPIFGKGLGYFSFGSASYGGDVYYVYMSQFGHSGNENSWLRIQGETGIFGLVIFVIFVAWAGYVAMRRFQAARDSATAASHFVAAAMAISLAAWAFTHDVFANYLLLMQWFLVLGASSGCARRDWAARREFSSKSSSSLTLDHGAS